MGRGVGGAVAPSLPPTAARVGVDGCPGGWLAAALVDGRWHFDVFPRFGALWDHLDDAATERVLVDVPIGLREDAVRECDEAARELLGARWNAVFRTPIRAAVELKRAEGPAEDRRPAASERNEAATGYGVSVQAWNIADRIAELEAFTDDHGLALDGPVREAHPELAFAAFNGQPVPYGKTGERGRALRRGVIADTEPGVALDGAGAAEAFDPVAPDDVLDAAALALAARTDLATVPAAPERSQPRIYYPDRTFDWERYAYCSG